LSLKFKNKNDFKFIYNLNISPGDKAYLAGKVLGVLNDGKYMPPPNLLVYDLINGNADGTAGSNWSNLSFNDTIYVRIDNYPNDPNSDPVIWAQKVVLEYNPYGSTLLNNWSGNLKIDQEGNYIFSALMGAGSMSTDNKFTGVLMGNIGKAFGNDKHGLYGYKEGFNTFKLTETGDAYFEGTVRASAGIIGDASKDAPVWNIGSFKDSSTTYWNSIFATREGEDDNYRTFFRMPKEKGSIVLGVKKYSGYGKTSGLTDNRVGNGGEYIFSLSNTG
jgi:hypothetical protein